MCLQITHANGYIEEINGNKYLIFDSTDGSKELKILMELGMKSKNVIMKKTKMKIDDKLPLNKPLKFHNITITIRSVFEEDGKLYPQLFLDDSLYDLSA